jgi:hypothetical protein
VGPSRRPRRAAKWPWARWSGREREREVREREVREEVGERKQQGGLGHLGQGAGTTRAGASVPAYDAFGQGVDVVGGPPLQAQRQRQHLGRGVGRRGGGGGRGEGRCQAGGSRGGPDRLEAWAARDGREGGHRFECACVVVVGPTLGWLTLWCWLVTSSSSLGWSRKARTSRSWRREPEKRERGSRDGDDDEVRNGRCLVGEVRG